MKNRKISVLMVGKKAILAELINIDLGI